MSFEIRPLSWNIIIIVSFKIDFYICCVSLNMSLCYEINTVTFSCLNKHVMEHIKMIHFLLKDKKSLTTAKAISMTPLTS